MKRLFRRNHLCTLPVLLLALILNLQGFHTGIVYASEKTSEKLIEEASEGEPEEASKTVEELETETESTSEAETEESQHLRDLLDILDHDFFEETGKAGETWAVSLAVPTDGEYADTNGDMQIKSASVIKVFIMATVCEKVLYPEKGQKPMEFEESWEGQLQQLLTDMITVSDNTAANTILEKLGGGDAEKGMKVVNDFCKKHGYKGTEVGRKFLEQNPKGDNYTTANDCRDILAAISEGTCVSKDASEFMYDLLKKQTRTWKLPAGLAGTGAVTANKTGELGGEYGDFVENDIAIVEADGTTYVIAVLSSDLKDNGTAQQKMQHISREVFEYLIHGASQASG